MTESLLKNLSSFLRTWQGILLATVLLLGLFCIGGWLLWEARLEQQRQETWRWRAEQGLATTITDLLPAEQPGPTAVQHLLTISGPLFDLYGDWRSPIEERLEAIGDLDDTDSWGEADWHNFAALWTEPQLQALAEGIEAAMDLPSGIFIDTQRPLISQPLPHVGIFRNIQLLLTAARSSALRQGEHEASYYILILKLSLARHSAQAACTLIERLVALSLYAMTIRPSMAHLPSAVPSDLSRLRYEISSSRALLTGIAGRALQTEVIVLHQSPIRNVLKEGMLPLPEWRTWKLTWPLFEVERDFIIRLLSHISLRQRDPSHTPPVQYAQAIDHNVFPDWMILQDLYLPTLTMLQAHEEKVRAHLSGLDLALDLLVEHAETGSWPRSAPAPRPDIKSLKAWQVSDEGLAFEVIDPSGESLPVRLGASAKTAADP